MARFVRGLSKFFLCFIFLIPFLLFPYRVETHIHIEQLYMNSINEGRTFVWMNEEITLAERNAGVYAAARATSSTKSHHGHSRFV